MLLRHPLHVREAEAGAEAFRRPERNEGRCEHVRRDGEDGTGKPVTYGGTYEEYVARSGHEAPGVHA